MVSAAGMEGQIMEIIIITAIAVSTIIIYGVREFWEYDEEGKWPDERLKDGIADIKYKNNWW